MSIGLLDHFSQDEFYQLTTDPLVMYEQNMGRSPCEGGEDGKL